MVKAREAFVDGHRSDRARHKTSGLPSGPRWRLLGRLHQHVRFPGNQCHVAECWAHCFHVKIYLPLGSSEGDYEIRILAPGEKVLFTANGVASVQQEIMPLNNP